jgi:hypothetical protein
MTMDSTEWLDWTGGGLAFGLLISSFVLLFVTIGINQRKKRH